MSAELHRWHLAAASDLPSVLGLAQEVVSGSGPVAAIVYTVPRVGIALLDGRKLSGPAGPIDLSTAFQARLFSIRSELRWHHTGAGAGDAVLLAETDLGPGTGWTRTGEPLAVEARPTNYLLWGLGRLGRTAGWTTLSEARIGELEIPIDGVELGNRVCLEAIEYLRPMDRHGNVRAFEERLTAFRRAEPHQGDQG